VNNRNALVNTHTHTHTHTHRRAHHNISPPLPMA